MNVTMKICQTHTKLSQQCLVFVRVSDWLLKYSKIPIISPGLQYIYSKGYFVGPIFEGAYFRRGLLSEGILHFKMGWG